MTHHQRPIAPPAACKKHNVWNAIHRSATLVRSVLARLAVAAVALAAMTPGAARAQDDAAEVALTPQTLGDALSCRSREALEAFAGKLFLDDGAPGWMHEIKDDKRTEGMLGLYGYALSQPAQLLGEPVRQVWFLQNWVVTLWPRQQAEAFIAAHHLARAPIQGTEQYYHFIDPEAGPMLGAFEPTGNATAAMMARALGAKVPAAEPSDSLFVGCNYSVVSQADFLDGARHADAIVNDAAKSLGETVQGKKRP
jgi:hypothetical protein